ncbi:MAG: PaaI family thioesterase [Desulfotalea sp.]
MIHRDKLPPEILKYIDQQENIDFNQFELPPPVFSTMKGEFISFDIDLKIFRCKFPVLKEHLNPYGIIQGGIIAAAIDNTIGPLSMLVAPPNITRKMDLKYNKTIEPEIDFFYITAKYIEQKKKFLFFEAIVGDFEETTIYASAKSKHWIL